MRSFQSGMRFPSGQPLWQKGIPQSMQRAPCARSLSSGILRSNSRQSFRRSLTGRREGVSRLISMKPVILPIEAVISRVRSILISQSITHSCRGWLDCGQPREIGIHVEMLPFEHHPILSRQYSYKLRSVVVPLVEDPPRDRALRVLQVPHDQRMQLLEFVAIADRTQLDHPGVAARRERAVFVKHVRHTAAHAGREVTAGLAQNHDQAARHVLASMVADSLDDRVRAAVTHRESLAGYAAEERFTAGGAVERDVADNDVVLGLEGRFLRRAQRDKSAREPLAAVVVRVAFEMERDSRREPRAET